MATLELDVDLGERLVDAQPALDQAVVDEHADHKDGDDHHDHDHEAKARLLLKRAPRIYAWVEVCEDHSGLEPTDKDWLDPNAIPPTIVALLKEFGRVYVPALLANEKAIANGQDSFETEIDGKPWKQQSFPYQAKCAQWIRNAYADLAPADRKTVDGLIAGTGIERLFSR